MKRVIILLWWMTAAVGNICGQTFSIDTISDEVFGRMKGKSYGANCSVARSELRYLRLSHYGGDGKVYAGELVCNKMIANDLKEIFQELFRHKYPIERMRLIDDYDADDERSMSDNNTSCFNYRPIAGSQKLSKHSQGLAIDINPLYNPCVRRRKDGSSSIQPKTARRYADRSRRWPYKIERGDLCHWLFTEHGFTWGGSWRSVKDYQHFER